MDGAAGSRSEFQANAGMPGVAPDYTGLVDVQSTETERRDADAADSLVRGLFSGGDSEPVVVTNGAGRKPQRAPKKPRKNPKETGQERGTMEREDRAESVSEPEDDVPLRSVRVNFGQHDKHGYSEWMRAWQNAGFKMTPEEEAESKMKDEYWCPEREEDSDEHRDLMKSWPAKESVNLQYLTVSTHG